MGKYNIWDTVLALRKIGHSWEAIAHRTGRTVLQVKNISKTKRGVVRDLYLDNQAKYRKNNAFKNKARRMVFVAVRNKTLLRQPCLECGEQKSEAHHEDYSKPLEIIWLCKTHHSIYDKNLRLRSKLLIHK